MKTGIELIAEERQEQIEKHNWTLQHDKEVHDEGSLIDAACAIAFNDENLPKHIFEAPQWAWDIRERKEKTENGRIERYKIAGALIADAIDLELNYRK